MLHFVRRSLLVQLLSVYLLFVIVVLIGGVGVNAVVEQQLRNDAQASDQALSAGNRARDQPPFARLRESLIALGKLVEQSNTPCRDCQYLPDFPGCPQRRGSRLLA